MVGLGCIRSDLQMHLMVCCFIVAVVAQITAEFLGYRAASFFICRFFYGSCLEHG